MSLLDFEPETLVVKTKKTEFSVRGLSIQDLSSLLSTHYTDLESLFQIYESDAAGASFTNVALARYASSLIKDAPGLVTSIIALAARHDSKEPIDAYLAAAERLGMLAQVDALKCIGKLTFEEVGGVKKLFEMVTGLAADLRGAAPTQQPK